MACGLPEEEYEALNEGKCSLKISMLLETDTRTFEQAVEKAQKSNRGCNGFAERSNLLLSANDLYLGELLSLLKQLRNQRDPRYIAYQRRVLLITRILSSIIREI